MASHSGRFGKRREAAEGPGARLRRPSIGDWRLLPKNGQHNVGQPTDWFKVKRLVTGAESRLSRLSGSPIAADVGNLPRRTLHPSWGHVLATLPAADGGVPATVLIGPT